MNNIEFNIILYRHNVLKEKLRNLVILFYHLFFDMKNLTSFIKVITMNFQIFAHVVE